MTRGASPTPVEAFLASAARLLAVAAPLDQAAAEPHARAMAAQLAAAHVPSPHAVRLLASVRQALSTAAGPFAPGAEALAVLVASPVARRHLVAYWLTGSAPTEPTPDDDQARCVEEATAEDHRLAALAHHGLTVLLGENDAPDDGALPPFGTIDPDDPEAGWVARERQGTIRWVPAADQVTPSSAADQLVGWWLEQLAHLPPQPLLMHALQLIEEVAFAGHLRASIGAGADIVRRARPIARERAGRLTGAELRERACRAAPSSTDLSGVAPRAPWSVLDQGLVGVLEVLPGVEADVLLDCLAGAADRPRVARRLARRLDASLALAGALLGAPGGPRIKAPEAVARLLALSPRLRRDPAMRGLLFLASGARDIVPRSPGGGGTSRRLRDARLTAALLTEGLDEEWRTWAPVLGDEEPTLLARAITAAPARIVRGWSDAVVLDLLGAPAVGVREATMLRLTDRPMPPATGHPLAG